VERLVLTLGLSVIEDVGLTVLDGVVVMLAEGD
jgi:hypothetical protein